MRNFVISGLVGLLLGVGLLESGGETESMAFARLLEEEMEVVQREERVSHTSDKSLTERKVTWLSLEDMSIIVGGDCPCYICGDPGLGFCLYFS